MTTERAEQSELETPPEAASGAAKPGPRGIGTAVAFDWGLSWQLLLTAPFFVLGAGPGDALAHAGIGLRLLGAAFTIVGAGIVFALGESVRRGRRLAWMVQIGLNALIFLAGFGTIPTAARSLGKGHVGDLVPTLIMLLISPVIVWLLTRRQTREWIATTTSDEARERHGGSWPWLISIWAIVGGTAVAFSGYY